MSDFDINSITPGMTAEQKQQAREAITKTLGAMYGETPEPTRTTARPSTTPTRI